MRTFSNTRQNKFIGRSPWERGLKPNLKLTCLISKIKRKEVFGMAKCGGKKKGGGGKKC